MRRVGSKIASPVLTNLKAWCSLVQGEIDDAVLVDSRFYRVGSTRRIELHSHIVSIEAVLPLIKPIVSERVRTPEVFEGSSVIEDFHVKLTRRPNAPG